MRSTMIVQNFGSWHMTNIQPSAALNIWLGVAVGWALRGVRSVTSPSFMYHIAG